MAKRKRRRGRRLSEDELAPTGEVITRGRYACKQRDDGHWSVWQWRPSEAEQRHGIAWYELPPRHPCRYVLPQCPPSDTKAYDRDDSYPCRQKSAPFDKDEWHEYQAYRRERAKLSAPHARVDRQHVAHLQNMPPLADLVIDRAETKTAADKHGRRRVTFAEPESKSILRTAGSHLSLPRRPNDPGRRRVAFAESVSILYAPRSHSSFLSVPHRRPEFL